MADNKNKSIFQTAEDAVGGAMDSAYKFLFTRESPLTPYLDPLADKLGLNVPTRTNLLSGDQPQIINENVRILVKQGIPQGEAVRRAYQYAAMQKKAASQ